MAKAQGLSMQTIVIAAIVLIILIVLVVIFSGRMRLFSKGLSEADSNKDALMEEFESGGSGSCISSDGLGCPDGYRAAFDCEPSCADGYRCCIAS